MKFLDENIWRKLHDFGLGNEFLDMIPNTQARKEKKIKIEKEKIDKWDHTSLQTFVHHRTQPVD